MWVRSVCRRRIRRPQRLEQVPSDKATSVSPSHQHNLSLRWMRAVCAEQRVSLLAYETPTRFGQCDYNVRLVAVAARFCDWPAVVIGSDGASINRHLFCVHRFDAMQIHVQCIRTIWQPKQWFSRQPKATVLSVSACLCLCICSNKM